MLSPSRSTDVRCTSCVPGMSLGCFCLPALDLSVGGKRSASNHAVSVGWRTGVAVRHRRCSTGRFRSRYVGSHGCRGVEGQAQCRVGRQRGLSRVERSLQRRATNSVGVAVGRRVRPGLGLHLRRWSTARRSSSQRSRGKPAGYGPGSPSRLRLPALYPGDERPTRPTVNLPRSSCSQFGCQERFVLNAAVRQARTAKRPRRGAPCSRRVSRPD